MKIYSKFAKRLSGTNILTDILLLLRIEKTIGQFR
jgi:hypothetical protein